MGRVHETRILRSEAGRGCWGFLYINSLLHFCINILEDEHSLLPLAPCLKVKQKHTWFCKSDPGMEWHCVCIRIHV